MYEKKITERSSWAGHEKWLGSALPSCHSRWNTAAAWGLIFLQPGGCGRSNQAAPWFPSALAIQESCIFVSFGKATWFSLTVQGNEEPRKLPSSEKKKKKKKVIHIKLNILNIGRWWYLLYYSQELRLKGLSTSWHSCNFPDSRPVCSCRVMPAWGFLSFPDSCQCVTDTNVAHRTFSVYLMSTKKQGTHEKFNHFLLSVIIPPLPKDIASVISTQTQTHSAATSDALHLCSLLWASDAEFFFLPWCYLRERTVQEWEDITQWSEEDCVFITD